jgi:hypothetical protein
MPKMVMKSFGKKNFMQPMGRPKHALKAPFFFSFMFWGGGGGGGGGGGKKKKKKNINFFFN